MQQREFDPEFDGRTVEEKKEFFRNRFTQWDGNHGAPIMRPAKEDSPEERKKEFDRLYGEGGFSYWGSNYFDGMFDRESNDLIYEYWRDSVRKRIKDEAKAGILAPKTSPYPFGTKRVPLEQTYFEAYNYDHVDIIDIQKDPIQSITASGIQTKSGASCDLDVLIFATGFDAATGSLTQIDIRGKEGKSLREEWRTGAKTFLGMAMEGFPNLFALYGPQSPSGTCNGPVCAQLQGDWLVNLFEHMKTRGKKYVEAQHDATEEWSAHATSTLKGTLLEETNSYFFGDNIPGKPRQLVYYFGGVPAYKGKLDEVEKEKYKEFDLLP
ncbi:hypothetical protein M501DRAFT_996182 [Patellaria atrata CBS 101060]|uniref:Cyclohexanone monooxygenase n=1 Tax=Patellaria atrata CBS 101060 TaxID=1346257 RepID=A0A9P4S8A5_9PEZI|nr:hypothetical protein M501DRAFT_996182 [Patellaria atrata CBS 101060]